jgi:hypothetical protein
VFVSKHYVKKKWTRLELKQALDRAFRESTEYILPVLLDDTKIPGLNYTTGYVDLRQHKIKDVAVLLLSKLGKSSLQDEESDRLGWDGKYVTYNGHRMVSYWPKKIREAQKHKSISVVQSFGRIKYGDESMDWGASRTPCHDCGVVKGQFHVPSCDVEECPICGGQAISCECNDDESKKIFIE